jgi:hypothetical protein
MNDTLERVRTALGRIVDDEGLGSARLSVLARPLGPEEAIGTPGRRDFPIVEGKERVLEARVREARGHAFTDSAREFSGTVEDVLALPLDTSQHRAIFLATLNALVAHLGRATATVHCRDDDPETCARTIAAGLLERFGRVRVGLVGLNPAIAERLVDTFGAGNVSITDRNPDNVGAERFGVRILDGDTGIGELAKRSKVVLVTGTTLTNGTFDGIWNRIHEADCTGILYGVTAAGVCALEGIERLCPCGRG